MSSMIGSLTPQCKQALALPLLFMLSSAGINASTYWLQNIEAQSPYNPACSLSTLVRCCYQHHPKTRYCWLVRPSQTGFPPVRLIALRLGAQSRFAGQILFLYRSLCLFPCGVKTIFPYPCSSSPLCKADRNKTGYGHYNCRFFNEAGAAYKIYSFSCPIFRLHNGFILA